MGEEGYEKPDKIQVKGSIMKHAYLIIAHNQIELLKTLIMCLDYSENDIYIHLDKKWDIADTSELTNIPKKSKIYILENRLDVKWGNFSQIECELQLLKTATKKKYQYYHLMSGVDLPLKSQKEIHKFFDENNGTEFVHFDREKIDPSVYKRVSKYNFFSSRSKNIFQKCAYQISMLLQFGVDRGKKYNLEFQKGANWFSITDELARYVVSQEEKIKKIFKYTICADEMFLQTVVINSKYAENLSPNNFHSDYSTIQYCIDWKRGNPYVFRLEDYDYLLSSNMCFARKFDWNIDNIIIKKISDYVLGDKRYG